MLKPTVLLGALIGFVTNAPLLAQQDDWKLTEIGRIGSVDAAETSLTLVPDGLIGPEGQLFALQPMDGNVRVFSAAGEPLRTIGSRGPGPGEFSSPHALGWAANGLYIVDRGTGRIAIFDTQGSLVRDWRPPIQPSESDGFPPVPEALLTGGRVLVNARRAYGLAEGSGVPERYFVVDTLGYPVGASFELETSGSRYAIRNPDQPVLGYFSTQPFRDDPLMGVDPRGHFIVVADRSVRESDASDRWARVGLIQIRPTGDTAWTARLSIEARPIPETFRDSIVEHEWEGVRQARGPGMSIPEKRKALQEVLYVPEIFPPIDQLVVDSEGNTWLRGSSAHSESPSVWWVFGPRGAFRARVVGPPGVGLLDYRSGLAMGAAKGDWDVQYLTVMRR